VLVSLLIYTLFPLNQCLIHSSAEMDVWEANSMATALTPHSCQPEGYSVCEDETCGGTYSLDRYAGSCDANGCDFNPYRIGNREFFGRGKTVDTTKKASEQFTNILRDKS